MHGYSIKVAEAVWSADENLPGVRLGRKCIAENIPIAEVARTLKVSRQTVYNWFSGKSQPYPRYRDAIMAWVGPETSN